MDDRIRLKEQKNGTYVLISSGRKLVYGLSPTQARRLAGSLDGEIEPAVRPERSGPDRH
ncbi:hypothetical protein [Methylobacterium oryzisoli]